MSTQDEKSARLQTIQSDSEQVMYWTRLVALQVLLVSLKFFNQLDFSWWVILSPVWYQLLCEVLLLPVVGILFSFAKR